MFKAILQLREPLFVGENAYIQIAGYFNDDDDNVWAETFVGTLLFRRDEVSFVVFLNEEVDLGTLDETILVLN